MRAGFLTVVVAIAAAGCESSAEPPVLARILPCVDSDVFDRSYTVHDAEDVAALGACRVIEGDLIVENAAMTSLAGLEGLREVHGRLTIGSRPGWGTRPSALTSLAGLEGLGSVGGDLSVLGNRSLTSLRGLDSLERVGGSLLLVGNDALASLEALAALTEVGGDLVIDASGHAATLPDALHGLDGLEGLVEIGGDLRVVCDLGLESLAGLGSLATVGGSVEVTNAHFSGCRLVVDGPPALATVGGDVRIEGLPATDLHGLASLEEVGGSLVLSRLSSLTSLAGLEALERVGGDLVVEDDPSLPDLDDLERLSELGGLSVQRNEALVGLEGLSAVGAVRGDALIAGNPALGSLAGLGGLTAVGGDLAFCGNERLADLQGLAELESVGGRLAVGGIGCSTTWDDHPYTVCDFPVAACVPDLVDCSCPGNPALESLDGLGSLASVGEYLSLVGNGSLARLDGLASLATAGDVVVASNPSLPTCAAEVLWEEMRERGFLGTVHSRGNNDALPCPP